MNNVSITITMAMQQYHPPTELREAIRQYNLAIEQVTKVLDYLITYDHIPLLAGYKELITARLETVKVVFRHIEAFLVANGQTKTRLQRWISNTSDLIKYVETLEENGTATV